jgi:hypothetical protein
MFLTSTLTGDPGWRAEGHTHDQNLQHLEVRSFERAIELLIEWGRLQMETLVMFPPRLLCR